MLRSFLCFVLLVISCSVARAEFPTTKDVLEARKKLIETRNDLNDAIQAGFKRAKGDAAGMKEVEARGTELARVVDLSLERMEHLFTLAALKTAAKGDAKITDGITLLATTNAERVAFHTKGNLQEITGIFEEAEDAELNSVAEDIRDRLRECRDLWAKCK